VQRESARAKEGDRPRYSSVEISLEIGARGSDAPAIIGPPVREDLFARMVRVIAEKAERMEVSGAQWLHVTVLTGLWAFTEWGRGPIASKTSAMATALAEALETRCPAGIVLTSAASLAPEDVQEELVRGSPGIGLRLGVQPLRARESLILPFKSNVAAADDCLALARAESKWLGWALARKGLPSIAELLNVPSG
jgi:hypothetical protein